MYKRKTMKRSFDTYSALDDLPLFVFPKGFATAVPVFTTPVFATPVCGPLTNFVPEQEKPIVATLVEPYIPEERQALPASSSTPPKLHKLFPHAGALSDIGGVIKFMSLHHL